MSDAGLYDRPVLVLDPGMHTAPIRRADVDRAGRFAVTASDDKTVRVWSLADGRLLRTIRLPAGPGNVGKAYAVAISPDGATIAAGGWTRWTTADRQEQIYLFDRESGAMTRPHRRPAERGRRPRLLPRRRPAGGCARARGPAALRARMAAAAGPEVAADVDYGDASYGVAFAADGRLATTSWDGRLRLYDADGELLRSVATPHARPYRPRLQPGGRPAGGRLRRCARGGALRRHDPRAAAGAGPRRHRQRQPRRRRLVGRRRDAVRGGPVLWTAVAAR